jgi:hypothetical protein
MGGAQCVQLGGEFRVQCLRGGERLSGAHDFTSRGMLQAWRRASAVMSDSPCLRMSVSRAARVSFGGCFGLAVLDAFM